MSQPKHIVVIAGEESGDIHAAHFISALKMRNPQLKITGIGGSHMRNAGADLLCDLAQFGVTGISEVIRHFKVIKQAFVTIKQFLSETKPDLLILVDYPGFNIRLAKYAKRVLGIKILYYISPQIWAWKAKRINILREVVDHMAVILPFEKSLYEKANIPVSFVGHPLVAKMSLAQTIPTTRSELNLPNDKTLIALLPGSRRNEIERHMPILKGCANNLNQHYRNIHFVIPLAASIGEEQISHYFKNTSIPLTLTRDPINTMHASDIIIVASGTASLECALLEKPMCIIYKASLLTYVAAMKFIKVKYLGLCNLLMNAMIVPELLQYDCNEHELTLLTKNLVEDKEVCARMTAKLQQLKHSLSSQAADCSIVELIENELR